MKLLLTFFIIFCFLLSIEAKEPDLYSSIKILNSLNLEDDLAYKELLTYETSFLPVLINAYYARHGRPQKKGIYREIFKRTYWYKVNRAYTNNLLTPGDIRNIKKIHGLTNYTKQGQIFIYTLKQKERLTESKYPSYGFMLTLEESAFTLKGRGFNEINEENLNVNLNVPYDKYGPGSWFVFENQLFFYIEKVAVVTTDGYMNNYNLYLHLKINPNEGRIESSKFIPLLIKEDEEKISSPTGSFSWEYYFKDAWLQDHPEKGVER